MSTQNISYRIFAISIVTSILFSLIPLPTWAEIIHPTNQQNNHVSPMSPLAAPAQQAAGETNFASILPASVQTQMESLGMIGEDGTPEGILFDRGALNQLDAATLPPSLANPISIARIQSAYVPNALDSGTLEIEFRVTNNQNPTLVPQIPENATVTETIDIVADFDFSADPNTIRNAIIADELTAATFATSIPLAETSASELIINLGDIAPLATVTATMVITVPATGGAFVELDAGARAFGSLKGRQVIGQAVPITLAPDSFAQYFIDTPDADINDEYMLNALAQVGGDPTAIFEYVQDFGFETYIGSLRGTRGTLWSEAGNSVDQSSLLIAMLRASGVPARYAHGTLFTQEAQTLIASMFPEPVSVVGHIPAGTELSSPTTDPQLIMETIDHWWAQAYIGGAWVNLDPSFANATIGQTFTTAVEDMAELPDTLRHKVTMAAKVEQYSAFPALVGYDGQTIIRPLEATFNSVELVG
ncbi:MAG TPA: transglutaminase family protein, partial [Anaerolineae bacterium]|nr:transglutaminase family protein [Anaerolineae bacterium]